MTDFFELDFLDVETSKSGDAIALRYKLGNDGRQYVHVVDAGFQSTGTALVEHIRNYYDSRLSVDHAVATHNDGDHSGGLREVLEKCEVGKLWMLCPWHYASALIDRFDTYSSVDRLVARLKEAYPNLAALEEIAQRRGIEIGEPFQGAQIGAFRVMAPSKARYLELVLASEKTPSASNHSAFFGQVRTGVMNAASAVAYSRIVTKYVPAAWGVEIFSSESTRCENEMSVIQYANLCDKGILLTGDAGRGALTEAADYLSLVHFTLPRLDYFQVPHHGSRRNVSSDVLDRFLGERLSNELPPGQHRFVAMISSAKEDEAHPRKAVVRAMIHRGGVVTATEGSSKCFHQNGNFRGWGPAAALPYPWSQEE